MGGTLLLAALPANARKTEQHPNIIYIMCDDMGYGDLGCYGQPFINTPCIDRMEQEGMRFTQAYAGSPVSAPSRASLMTGQHTGHCLVRGNKEYWKDVPMVEYGQCTDYSRVCCCGSMSAICCDEIYWRALSYGVYNTIYCGSLCHIIICSYFFRSKKGAVLLRFYRSAWMDHLLYNVSI